MKVLLTGGAGFIGSHLVDALMSREFQVCVLDNLSEGKLENVSRWLNSSRFELIRGDLLNPLNIVRALKECEVVFHLAATPEVRISSIMPDVHFAQNVTTTNNLLEAMRKTKTGKTETLVFTSSSTVYGEPSQIPTPEDYAPLVPISVYGACKLASEALAMAYAHAYGFRCLIYRLANIVGPRSRHGVTYDFINKLMKDSSELEILGDGSQTKSYLHVNDCIEAMMLGLEKLKRQVDIFNIGSEDQVDVRTIAETITTEMKIEGVNFKFTGGVDGGRGWKGDVKNMLLDVSKLKSMGWRPRYNSAEAVRKAAQELLGEIGFKRP